ncbi:OmpA family protein [Rhizobium wuzhouense]|uniref:OmpA family protein n=1 Tax=Rhizobium wuzhouense TaxID=1986026 RepID=UPI0010576885|nr:OmpA family protein [Rhizobium wuzhouense]
MTRGLLLALTVLLPVPALAYTVSHEGGPVGDMPSRFESIDFPQSRFAPRPTPSDGNAAAGSSSFSLKNLESEARARTEALLSELGAHQEGSSIHVSLPGDVLFDFDKSDIRADAEEILVQMVTILTALKASPVQIEGHTDSKGGDDYNIALSARRATAVRDWLSDHGIDLIRLSTTGKGEAEPVAPNETSDGRDDPVGRQKNRRVEFIIDTGE